MRFSALFVAAWLGWTLAAHAGSLLNVGSGALLNVGGGTLLNVGTVLPACVWDTATWDSTTCNWGS